MLGMMLLSGYQSMEQNPESGDQEIILVTPNLDDDDGDGQPDASDNIINGPSDRQDLIAIQIPTSVSEGDLYFSGPGADLYRVVEIIPSPSDKTTVWLEARGPKSSHSMATLTVSGYASHGGSVEYRLDVKPFVLYSNIHPVREIFICDRELSIPGIKQLTAHLAQIPNAPKLTIVDKGEVDVLDEWMQDATEIGSFADTSIHAAIAGLRGKHNWPVPKNLDQRFTEVFFGPDRCVLHIGQALPDRAYIDWFGNLELTPPCVGPDGTAYPMGRILTGLQNQLGMHETVMTFLQEQAVQWPPIVLDTGFLWIGHIDEIVNFIPTDTGFKALVVSPTLGCKLFEELESQGHGDAVILQGLMYRRQQRAETTVARLLNDPNIMAINDAAAKVMIVNRQKLKYEMNLDEEDIIDLPIIFMKQKGEPVWPNPVNGIVINNHYLISKPHGPIIDGKDAIQEAYRKAFTGTGTILHFVDAWDAFSKKGGDIHCGTNTVRYRR